MLANVVLGGDVELLGLHAGFAPLVVGGAAEFAGFLGSSGLEGFSLLGGDSLEGLGLLAGDIAEVSPAGRWLKSRGLEKRDFNSYGSRRGNDLVMVRGTFANIRLKNLLIAGSEGNLTVHLPDGEQMAIFDASERYRQEGVPLIVLAGKEYGSGSSRDWAAKGPNLLGVRAVITQSFERIHRSNLIGMGVLPLCFEEGTSWQTLGLKGDEQVTIRGLHGEIKPRQRMIAEIVASDGGLKRVPLICRIDTLDELDYFKHGGILQYVLRHLVAA